MSTVLSEMEKNSIRQYVNGLTPAEMQYLASCVPVQFCHNIVGQYIIRSQNFKNDIYNVVANNDWGMCFHDEEI